jgi:predicted metalloprotease with PDZ domain
VDVATPRKLPCGLDQRRSVVPTSAPELAELRPVTYDVDLSGYRQHLVHVRVEVPEELASAGRIALPVWTPGSYVVRDYARHVQRIDATDTAGRDVEVTPDGRSAWLLPDEVDGPVWVRLELYANELTVRTNHVDDHHALLVSAATFPSVEGGETRRQEVRIDAPEGWSVWSLIPSSDGVHVAVDYDHLVDSAFYAGPHEDRGFTVRGVPHTFVWGGHGGRPDLDRITSDAAAIAGAAVELMEGELPVEHYTFLCTAWDTGAGGLEHRDGAVLQFPAHRFRTADGYDRFTTLVAHEYLHVWNVKRLVPTELVSLDYERPVHTTSLWVVEGWTAYYDEVLPVRAGVRPVKKLVQASAKQIRRVLERPGRHLQSVQRSSWEAWTKFYVRDENSPNVGVSYYEHGAVLAWCLDLLIRREDPDGEGLDTALRLLWKRHAGSQRGYTEADVIAAVSEAAGRDTSDFFAEYVSGTATPPIEGLLEVIGLELRAEQDPDDHPPPDLGVETEEDERGIRFTTALRGRPAWEGGVTGGDRLVAIEGVVVGAGELDAALRAHAPGDTVEVAVVRGPRLLRHRVTLGPPRPAREIRAVESPSRTQARAFRRWSAAELSELDPAPHS